MSKGNKDFFEEKKIWSEVKDELLGCYLVPYFNKIMSMNNPILYVDCFAGKGKFDDGKNGSPLIAIECLEKSIAQIRNKSYIPQVYMKFIELHHASDLRNYLNEQSSKHFEVIEGKFEDKIVSLLNNALSKNRSTNLFLYVDPYGVKVLNATLFDILPNAFKTAELLINLNSFGFIRLALQVMKITVREKDDVFSDLEEYDNSVTDSIEELNTIAGGNYWQSIIENYKNGTASIYQAEKDFAQGYKIRLRKKYTYVLDMPIRMKAGQQPKYRMIHATNHHVGCLLMADNIAKRTDYLVIDIQSGGQLSFMQQTAENEMIDDSVLEEKVLELLSINPKYIHLNEFLADFYNEYGVLCDLSRLSSGRSGSVLKRLEKNGVIQVMRNPATTEKGKPTSFWQEIKGQTLMLRKVEN